MQEEYDAKKFLFVLLLLTFIIGFLVILFKSDYRIQNNIFSNMDYYPHVSIERN